MTDQRIEKWCRWLDKPIKSGVITLHHHRQIWREIGDIIKKNGNLPDSVFWQYHRDLYGITQAIGIRRQADLHPDVASLAKLLVEVRDNPDQVTPAFWLSLWEDQDDAAYARRQWDKNYGGDVGDHLDPAMPAADYKELTAAAASAKDYVDKHVAHADQRPVAAGASVTFAQIDGAIDVLGRLFRRYYALFTAADMYTLEPIIQHDWKAIFRVQWLPDLELPEHLRLAIEERERRTTESGESD
jgi:hypothetical protein